jgi:replicative DNA helicase
MTNLISQYIASFPLEDEWRVLVTLAAASSPAAACRSFNWRVELFSNSQTQEAFSLVAREDRSFPLSLPESLRDPVPYSQEELRAARVRMGCVVLFTRLLPTFQSNLRERLLSIMDANVPTDGSIVDLLTGMVDTTLTGMDVSLTTLKTILSPDARDQVTITTQQELDASYWERIGAMREAATTGFRGLNRVLSGGLHADRLMIILGAPGAGKTTFVHQIAEYVANRGRPAAYLACEESPATLYAKTLARLGGVDYAAAQFGWPAYKAQIDAARAIANGRLSATRLLYIDGFRTLTDLRATVQSHFARYRGDTNDAGGPGLLIVDYLQCLAQIIARQSGTPLNENQIISQVCYDLRQLAKELTCTVIAISRQHRAGGYGSANALSSGSGSGSIEYGADVVMCIDKDEERKVPIGWKGRVVVIPKNRLGEADVSVQFDWRGNRQEFRETNWEANEDDEQ